MLVLVLDRWDANELGEKAQMHPAAGLPQGPALARRSDLAPVRPGAPGGIAGRALPRRPFGRLPADPPRVCH